MSIAGGLGKAERPALLCDTTAIPADARPRYRELCRRLRSSILSRRELEDGYRLQLAHDSFPLVEAAQWIAMERLCCPFLKFRLEVDGNSQQWRLSVRGPAGSKPILAAAFGE
jgi:hypothetical protein